MPNTDDEHHRLDVLRRLNVLDTPPEAAFDEITRLASALLRTPIALVSLIDADRQWFKSRHGTDLQQTPREHAFCNHAIQGEDVFVVDDATQDERFADNPYVTGDTRIRFYAGAPLRTQSGVALGTLCVIDSNPRDGLSVGEKRLLQDMASVVVNHMEARQAIGYIEPATGLPNRFRFLKDIDEAARDAAESERFFAIVVKVCSTSQYGDMVRTLGHAVADGFDIAAAARLRPLLPPTAKLYHLMGGTFGFLLKGAGVLGIRRALDPLASAISAPIETHGLPLATRKGIGYAEYPSEGPRGDVLLRAATSAAKRSLSTQSPWCDFNQEWDRAQRRQFSLLRELLAAIAAPGQLRVAYQPQTDLATGRCHSVEALLRWDHPDLGAVSPGEFIPLAEQTGVVPSVTDWLFDNVLPQVALWRAEGHEFLVCLNVSVVDLEQTDFVQRCERYLAKHTVSPEWIGIEITESAMIHDRGRVAGNLKALDDLGIEIAVDDFGTGQSALSYLKQMAAKVVKIDQVFIRQLATSETDRILVSSTIDLCHKLGFRVIAEGIETQAAFDWLKAQGCDVGQGYLIARPLPAADVLGWVSNVSPAHYAA